MLLSMLPDAPMGDILHDSAFQFAVLAIISIVGIIIASVVSYRIASKQRTKKEISYQFLGDFPIASIDRRYRRLRDRLQVLFDGIPVENLRIVILKVWNSGNADVKIWNSRDVQARHEDYEVPISFEFEGGKVVDWSLEETSPPEGVIEPKDLEAYLPPEQRLPPEARPIELPHCLLKPNQSITLRILLTGWKGNIIKKGKLFEGKILEYNPDKEPIKIRVVPILLILTFTLIIFIIIYWWSNTTTFDFWGNTASSLAVLAAIGTATSAVASVASSSGIMKRIRKNGLKFRW